MIRIFSLLAALAVLPLPASGKTHFLLIMADDLGWSDLGCYGGEIPTPQLDALAQGGLRFTQFYNTARCWPTRGALLTGYYAQQIHRDELPGLGGGGRGIRPPWARLLPDFLQPAGYRCYHSGKWHIDGPVLAGGFDRSLDVRNQGNFFSTAGNFVDDAPLLPERSGPEHYSTIVTADHAIECLKDHAIHHADQPFFHYLAFIAPHFPLHALPEDIARHRDRYLEGWEIARTQRHARQRSMGLHSAELSAMERELGPPYHFPEAYEKLGPGEVRHPLPWDGLTEEQRRFQATKMAIHAAMVECMDREIGRVVAQLKAMGAYEDTLILFLSDNGTSAEIMVRHGGHDPQAEPGSADTYLCLGPGFSSLGNTPFRRHKTWVHEGGISTPFIAHWPRGIKDHGALRKIPAHVIDVVPTLLELAGVKKPVEWQGQPIPPAPGKSLAPVFAKDVLPREEPLWWLHEGNRALRVGGWKLVAAKDQAWELYDLSTDRTEQHDLAKQMPDKVRELAAAWEQKTRTFSELAQQTLHLQPKPGTGKGSKKKVK